MPDEIFACVLTDEDLTRACAPEQPEVVAGGQTWMRLADGATLPVKRVHGRFVDLGSKFLTVVMQEPMLRAEWVCTDAPDNVVVLSDG